MLRGCRPLRTWKIGLGKTGNHLYSRDRKNVALNTENWNLNELNLTHIDSIHFVLCSEENQSHTIKRGFFFYLNYIIHFLWSFSKNTYPWVEKIVCTFLPQMNNLIGLQCTKNWKISFSFYSHRVQEFWGPHSICY